MIIKKSGCVQKRFYQKKCNGIVHFIVLRFAAEQSACLTDLFSGRSYCVETSHLIRGAYRLTGFFAVGMSTGRVFQAGIIFC